MRSRVAVTILRPREQVEHFWQDPQYRSKHIESLGAAVSFVEAPGDRGTEIHVELETHPPAGVFGDAVQELVGTEPVAKVKDDLRRFKQRVETGVIARSEAVPQGELLERKLKQRPAQPLKSDELQKAGA